MGSDDLPELHASKICICIAAVRNIRLPADAIRRREIVCRSKILSIS
jgi:hypothetical protein